MFRKFLFVPALVCLSMTAAFAATGDGENTTVRSKRAAKKLSLKVVPWGPSQADVDAARQRVVQSGVVQRELQGSNYREVGFEYLYDRTEGKADASTPPTRFRVIYYNYSTDMALFVE